VKPVDKRGERRNGVYEDIKREDIWRERPKRKMYGAHSHTQTYKEIYERQERESGR
jgi:hypothetical protein